MFADDLLSKKFTLVCIRYICTLPVQGGFVMGPVAAICTTPKAGVQFQYFAFDKFRKT
jgi:hypothetical protein